MKHIFLKFLHTVALISCLCWLGQAQAATQGESLDKIVAVVNDVPITQSDLDKAISTAKKQIAGNNLTMPAPEILRKQVLDQLVMRKLELQIAEQGGIHTTDEQVNKTIKGIAENNHLSTKELFEKISQQGIDLNDYKKEIREEMTIQQLEQAEVGSHITFQPQEVEDYMHSSAWENYSGKEYHLEDILVPLPDSPTTQDIQKAKIRAQKILNKIHHGLSFQAAATADSGDSNALQGGDLGWRQLAQIPTAFANQITSLKVNDIMGPIETPNGFHLVKLSGIRHTSKTMTAADERKQVQQLLFQRKMEEGIQTWTAKLRSAAFINMNPDS